MGNGIHFTYDTRYGVGALPLDLRRRRYQVREKPEQTAEELPAT